MSALENVMFCGVASSASSFFSLFYCYHSAHLLVSSEFLRNAAGRASAFQVNPDFLDWESFVAKKLTHLSLRTLNAGKSLWSWFPAMLGLLLAKHSLQLTGLFDGCLRYDSNIQLVGAGVAVMIALLAMVTQAIRFFYTLRTHSNLANCPKLLKTEGVVTR